jgi:hypothetical protein
MIIIPPTDVKAMPPNALLTTASYEASGDTFNKKYPMTINNIDNHSNIISNAMQKKRVRPSPTT